MREGSRRGDGFAFPDSLRLPGTRKALEAFGLRARAREVGGVVELEIEGRRAQLTPVPPLSRGDSIAWPFAAARGSGAAREILFAAPDQPVLAVIRERAAPPALEMGDAPFALSVLPLGDARHAIVVHDAAAGPVDLLSLVAAATARARRRAANRPVLWCDAEHDEVFATAEHELRGELRRVGPDAVELFQASAREQACAALALYALNDGATADELVRSLAHAPDGLAAALAFGASAAWRGSMPDAAEVREAARAWLRAAAAADPGTDEWHRAALALAPAAAEAMGATDVATMLRARGLPAVPEALVGIARAAGEAPGGRVLHAMHATVGIAPDALRGRVAIHPASSVHGVDVEQVAVGDGTLAYRAEVGPDRASFEVEQTAGGTPLTVLLEPMVPGRRLRSARVDDTPAQLDALPEGSDLRVKVQLVADRPRRLELHYER